MNPLNTIQNRNKAIINARMMMQMRMFQTMHSINNAPPTQIMSQLHSINNAPPLSPSHNMHSINNAPPLSPSHNMQSFNSSKFDPSKFDTNPKFDPSKFDTNHKSNTQKRSIIRRYSPSPISVPSPSSSTSASPILSVEEKEEQIKKYFKNIDLAMVVKGEVYINVNPHNYECVGFKQNNVLDEQIVTDICDSIFYKNTFLIEKYCDFLIKYNNMFYLSAFMHYAVTNNSEPVVNYLLDKDIYYSPIEFIIYKTATNSIKLIEEEFLHHLDLIIQYDKILIKIYNMSIIYDNKRTLDYIRKHSDIESRLDFYFNLHNIILRVNEHTFRNIENSFRYYIENKYININLLNKNNETPLMVAIKNKKEKMISIILKYNCDLKCVNKEGKSALDLAHEHDINFELIHKISTLARLKFYSD